MRLFNESVYKRRREELSKFLKPGIVLFLGHNESPRNFRDNTYKFRQDSTFLYFFGLGSPDLTVIYDLENQRTTLFGEETSEDDIVWRGIRPDLGNLASQAGIDKISTLAKLPGVVTDLLKKNVPVYFLPPYRTWNKVRISEILQIPIDRVELSASPELIKAVVAMRSVKEACEIQEIEKAIDLTRELHLKVIYDARPGIGERELVGKISELIEASSYDLAYPVILSVHGEILHNYNHGDILEKGQLLLGDFGAETDMGYASDITRTIPVERCFSQQQREIYQVVLAAQQAAVQNLRSGVLNLDIHFIAAKKIAAGLKDIGIMRGDTDEAVALGAHALFFPHGIGHMIGLDVHDMEDLGEDVVGYKPDMVRNEQFGQKSLRLAKKLQPGFTISIEPGIYFIPALIDMWESKKKYNSFINYAALNQYRSFGGIRIEDDYLITDSGARLLGKPIPETIEELEFLRGASIVEVS